MTNDEFNNAIKEVLGGFLKTALIFWILSQTNLKNDIVAFIGFNSLADIAVIYYFDSWGIPYLLGWLTASGLLTALGLLSQDVFTLYLIVGVLILLGNSERKKKKRRKRG
jgi:4-amino-4-deoxy-L-arabinose transferase-like glycosyltransferase